MHDRSLYTLSEVEQLIGVSKKTLDAWELRHQASNPMRPPGNRRLYDDNDVYRLHVLNQLVKSGEPIGKIAALSLSVLEARLHQLNRNETAIVQQLIEIIRKLDQTALDHKLSEFLMVHGPIDFTQDIVLPTLREIGQQWAQGTVSISSEHMFTASARSLLGLALLQGPAQSEDLCVMFSTPTGEPHELGVMAAAVAARNRGIRVAYLGPQLPADEILHAAETVEADIICLGSVLLGGQTLSDRISPILADLSEKCELWLGGNANPTPEVSNHPLLRLFPDLEAFENALRIRTLPTFS
ncbi:MAG: MerR family transcriptional regulator [Alphaproteobacteria bacterium]|nr:MerR family transcriptional regulator [Alphaproteobacteria bacterium]